MRRVLKWGGYALLALIVVAVAGGMLYREELRRLHAVNTLFDPDRIVGNFSNMESAFLTTPVPRGDTPAFPLETKDGFELPSEVQDWIVETGVTGFIVLDGATSAFEDAYLGTELEDRRISWSIAKSFLSALFGISVAEGEVELAEDVTTYAPILKGGAYDGVSVHDVLTMQSGVTFDEDVQDPRSDINRMGRVIALGGTMDGFAAGLTERDGPAGEKWDYVSIDTHILAMVLRGATGRSLPDLMSERLIAPLRFDADPYFLTDGEGVAFSLGGLNLTLRDYARFGLMIAQEGMLDGVQIVPEDWVVESTKPQAETAEGKIRYGYQWWIPWDSRPEEVLGRGLYGQFLYIDRARDIVVVATSADLAYSEKGRFDAGLSAMRLTADAVVAGR